MPATTTKISVIIPTFNRCELLRELLRGLSRQQFPNHEFEVIVVDDGSTDDTAEIAKSFAETLRLEYHYQENLGFRVAAARNAGARLATAPLLIFLDTGTLIGPDLLRNHSEAHHADPEHHVVIGYAYAYRPEDPTPGLPEAVQRLRPEKVVDFYRDDPSFWDIRHGAFLECGFDVNARTVPWILLWATNCSVRADDFWAVGGFDEDFQRWGVEDMELGFRLHRHGIPFTVSRDAWVIEAPHDRDWDGNAIGNRRNMGQLLQKFPEPVIEIGWALIHKDLYWPWEDDYQQLGKWTAQVRALDVSQELREVSTIVGPADRIAVFGCGGEVPLTLPPAVLVDFDRELLDRALADGRHTGHHAIGLRTPLPDQSVDLVVLTSRLSGLWNRWGLELVAEARRVGREVRACGLGQIGG